MEPFNLCIIKPNKDAFSETFIQEHINRLPGNKKVCMAVHFPLFDHNGNYLIKSKIGLLSYLIQKRMFKKKDISVRTNALVKYLKEQKIDVVFVEYFTVGAMVTEACRLANVPLVIHCHGFDVHHQKTVAEYLPWYKRAFNYASAFIAVSGDMAIELKRLGATADKVHVASCGVDTSKFPVLDILNTPPNFLAVGRFVEKKSPQSVVKAFKQVVDKFANAKLWMVGQGPLFDDTKELIAQLGLQQSIILTGVLKTEQIKELMQHTRIFVQHSVTAKNGDKEGTPVTILEAGSSGLAIVSTLHTGIKEAVLNNETGYLVPEYGIDSMANYMITLAGDVNLAAKFGIKEAAHIRENYDINDRIKTITTLLLQAIKN